MAAEDRIEAYTLPQGVLSQLMREMAGGRLLLSGTLDVVKERLVRLRVLCEGMPPDPSSLGGTVLRHERDRNQARVVLLDPDPEALAALRVTPGVREMQETPLTLEEAYCALLEQKEELP